MRSRRATMASAATMAAIEEMEGIAEGSVKFSTAIESRWKCQVFNGDREPMEVSEELQRTGSRPCLSRSGKPYELLASLVRNWCFTPICSSYPGMGRRSRSWGWETFGGGAEVGWPALWLQIRKSRRPNFLNGTSSTTQSFPH
jgi:hypothetical protein